MSVILNPYSNTQLQNDLRKLLLANNTLGVTAVGSGAPPLERGNIEGNSYWDQLNNNFWIFSSGAWQQVANSTFVQIEIISGSPTFKNHTGAVSLKAALFQNGVDKSSTVTSWQWYKNVPPPVTTTVGTTISNIQYGTDTLQKVDIIPPSTWNVVANTGTPPQGVVLWIHGGAWNGGDKTSDTAIYNPIVLQNYMVIAMNYRLTPSGAFPNDVNDVAQVINFLLNPGAGAAAPSSNALWANLQSQVASYGLMVAGNSAGGHLAIEGVMAQAQAHGTWPRGCMNLYGPMNLVTSGSTDPVNPIGSTGVGVINTYTASSTPTAASPYYSLPSWQTIPTFATNNCHFFIWYNSNDTLVPPTSVAPFAASLTTALGPTKVTTTEVTFGTPTFGSGGYPTMYTADHQVTDAQTSSALLSALQNTSPVYNTQAITINASDINAGSTNVYTVDVIYGSGLTLSSAITVSDVTDGSTGANGLNGLTALNAYQVLNQNAGTPTFTTPTALSNLPTGWYASSSAALAAAGQSTYTPGYVLWYLNGQYNSTTSTINGVGANTTAWTGPIAATIFQDIRSDNWDGGTPPTSGTFTPLGTQGYYIQRTTGVMYLNSVLGRGVAEFDGTTSGPSGFSTSILANKLYGQNSGVEAYSNNSFISSGALRAFNTSGSAGNAIYGSHNANGNGVLGQSASGVGVSGTGSTGVQGSGTNGVTGTGSSAGVIGTGGTYGVYGSGTYGLYSVNPIGTASNILVNNLYAQFSIYLVGQYANTPFYFYRGPNTGSGVATFNATNKPGSSTTNTWIEVNIGGVSYQIPVWAS